MYPDFQYLLQSLTGADMPEWIGIFKTFGFLVALSFFAAAWTLSKELKRKEAEGLLTPTFTTIEIGKAATPNDLFWSALIGFVLGYKIGGIWQHAGEISPDPMGYIFSLQGSVIFGVVGALLLAANKYYELKKQTLPQPETKRVAIYPHQRISEIVMIAAVGGIVGAKVFNAFETWEDFLKNPIANLISSSGLTFYGGLIVATVSLYYYSKKHNIPFKHLCDAAAPGLMLSYGLGRLGCHFAGDGDWGIFNSAYVTDASGVLRAAASPVEYVKALQYDPSYFKFSILREFETINNIPHIYAKAPSWLPDWMYAMNYPHNVNNDGILLSGCTGNYCAVLPVGVFPTPLYEAFTCVMLFLVLWGVRKRLKFPLQLFGLYLILNGIERFFIEKIRVNFKYDWGFLHPTQAEIISVVMALLGIALLVFASRQKSQANP